MPFIANIGILFMVAWGISCIGRRTFRASVSKSKRQETAVGALFGAAAAVLMLLPVELEPGIFGDARGGPILLSGVIGGPVAASVATLMAAAMRGYLGGSGMVPGMAYIVIFGLSSVVFHYVFVRGTDRFPGVVGLLGLATAATAIAMPVILLLPESAQWRTLTNIWPLLYLSNLIGAMVLGLLFSREHNASRWLRENASREAAQRSIVESTAEGVITIDHTGVIETFNPAAEKLFGYTADEAVGRNVRVLMPEMQAGVHDGFIKSYLAGGDPNTFGTGRTVKGQRNTGEKIDLYLSISETTNSYDGGVRFVGVMHDVGEQLEAQRRMTRTVDALSTLATISASPGDSPERQFSQALGIALGHLGLEIGIVSRVLGDVYTVLHVSSPEGLDLRADMTFERKQTYCDIALAKESLVAIDHMKDSIYSEHPCYSALGLESYIGAPYHVNGVICGTVNFSSQSPRPDAFDDVDKEFVSLVARWVGSVFEKEEAVERLRRSELRLSASQTFANIGTWDWNIQTGGLYWSDQVAPMFGGPNRELETTYEDFVSAVHPEDRDRLVDRVTTCIEGGNPYSIEYRVVWQDGTERWLQARGDIVRATDGTPKNMLGLVQDITERKRAEDELRRTNTELLRFRWITDTSDELMSFIDRDFVYREVNAFYLKAHGRRRRDIVGRSVADLMGQDVFESTIKEKLDRCLAGETIEYEQWFDFPGLGRRYMEVRYSPFWESDGVAEGIVVTVADVTARHEAEAQLRLLTGVTEYSSEAIVITDPDEVIQYVNAAFTRITGYTSDEVIGQTPRILASGRHDKKFYDALWGALDGTGLWQGEIWNRRKDGSIYPEFVTINKVRDPEGSVTSYIAVFSDISRIKRREEELRKINAELEEFAYVTSHDLREPLRMIGSYTGLIERQYGDSFDDQAREYFGFVRDGAERMDNLIQDILTFSRIGRVEADRAPVDMAALVQRVTAGLGMAVAEADAEIVIAPDLPRALAVESEIERVLTNLVSNALKYRDPEHRIRIEIGGRTDRGHGVYSVADTGVGIDPMYHERIFRIFQRLHAREAHGGGTGIGLAICRKVIEQHGGRIWVESEPDRGSRFTFTLPLANGG